MELEAAGDPAEQRSLRAGGGKRDAHPRGGLGDAGGNLEQAQAQGRELGAGERLGPGDCITHRQHQPVGGGVQHQAHLVGQGRPTTGAIRGKLALVELDQVLRLAPGTVERVVEPLGAAAGEAGHHAAYVQTQGGGLDPGRDPAFAAPGSGAVAGLGVAAQHRRFCLGAADPDIVGRRLEQPGQHGVAGQAEDEVHAVGLAPRHHLGTAVVAIAADRQPRGGPVAADAAHQAPEVAAHLDATGRPARAQNHRDRARGGDVVDVDGHEAALVVMRVEQRELLVAMHHIHRVVDVQRHRFGRPEIAGAVEIDHGVAQAHDLAQGGRILAARHGGLGAQVASAVGQAPAGELEARVGAQVVEVVGVLVATGDGEHAGSQDVGDAVGHQRRVARIGDQPGQAPGHAQAALGGGQKHDAAVRRHAAAIEGSGELLAADGWKEEGCGRIIGHGGCGAARLWVLVGLDTRSVNAISSLRDTRRRIPAMP